MHGILNGRGGVPCEGRWALQVGEGRPLRAAAHRAQRAGQGSRHHCPPGTSGVGGSWASPHCFAPVPQKCSRVAVAQSPAHAASSAEGACTS